MLGSGAMLLLTRRRFAALASASAALLRLPAARAAGDAAPCSMSDTYVNWQLSAWYADGAAAPSYAIALRKSQVPYPNAAQAVLISTFALSFDGARGNYAVTCVTEWPQGANSGDEIDYEVISAGAALVSFRLTPGTKERATGIGEASLERLAKADSEIRVSFGAERYQLTLAAQSFRAALGNAQALAQRVAEQHAGKACAPLDKSSCVLTTVACQAVGLPDDCFELEAMRRLRARWILRQAFGPAVLAWYYGISETLLRAVPRDEMAPIFRRFYAWRVLPAVLAERLGWHRGAYLWLRAGVESLAARYGGDGDAIRDPSARRD